MVLVLVAAAALAACGGAVPSREAPGGKGGSNGDASVVSTSGGSEGTADSATATGGGTGGGAGAPPLQAMAVAVGTAHSCALLTTSEVACWGDGSVGQLGDGNWGAGYSRATPVKVPGLTGVQVLSAGGDTTCAGLADGVVCWGDGTFGQLGDGMAGQGYSVARPVNVQGLGSVKSLGISDTSVCAVAADRAVFCWGRNTADGWLGFTSSDCGPYTTANGTVVDQPCEKAPARVPGVTGALDVTTGSDHCCAVTDSGAVSCWGADTYGQLGDDFSGTAPHDAGPFEVAGLTNAHLVSVGTSFSCGVAGGQRAVSCWGDNSSGQLGTGSAVLDAMDTTPMPVNLDDVIDLSAAESATCVVTMSGSVSCWGSSTTLFPPADGGPTTVPTAVAGVVNAVSVRTSGGHACALLADQTVVCWGSDAEGQLGDGQQTLGAYTPTPVSSP